MREWIVLGCTAVVFAGGIVWHAAPSSPVPLTSVALVDDMLQPIPGGIVNLQVPGSEDVTLVTDAFGQTRWAGMDPSGGVLLSIADNAVDGGLALGSIQGVVPPPLDDASVDTHEWMIAWTQPVAENVLVAADDPDGITNVYPRDGAYPHWTIGVEGKSGVQFQAGVAPLLDGEAIAGYMGYRGQPTLADKYVRGTALTVPAVDLGESGFFLCIDLLGDLPNPDSIAVDAFNLHHETTTTPGFDVSLVSVSDGIAICRVSGELLFGHLAILLRDVAQGGAGIEVSAHDDPPQFSIPQPTPDEADPTTAWLERGDVHVDAASATCPTCPPTGGAAVTECEPDVPGMGDWDCSPGPPPASPCPSELLLHDCGTYRTRSPRFCRGPGETLARQMGTTKSYKFVLKVTGGTAPLVSGGQFEYGTESKKVQTDEWTAQPGAHGLGQCIRWYRFYLVCGDSYEQGIGGMVADPESLPHWDPCAGSKKVSVTCGDETDSSSTCDRAP